MEALLKRYKKKRKPVKYEGNDNNRGRADTREEYTGDVYLIC